MADFGVADMFAEACSGQNAQKGREAPKRARGGITACSRSMLPLHDLLRRGLRASWKTYCNKSPAPVSKSVVSIARPAFHPWLPRL